jgi:hypothetical protein
VKTAKTATSYAVELTTKESVLVFSDSILYDRLNSLPGVRDIDYDGQFGPYILFTVCVEDDTPELHAEVLRICRKRLSEI